MRNSGWRQKWDTSPAMRYASVALAGAFLFLAVLADTAFDGLLTKGLNPVNDQVSAWRDAGYPVHAWGRELSKLGDFLVGFPLLACAVGLLLGAGAWRRALAVIGVGGLAPYIVLGLQQALSGLNYPIPGLDPLIVPDTQSAPRVDGEHLFPSGHMVQGTLDWGLLFVLAVPLVLRRHVQDQRAQRLLVRGAFAVWVAGFALTGVGRVLRQAHGYNDVLAGWGVGLALLFGTLGLLQWLWPDEAPPADSRIPRKPAPPPRVS